MTSSPYFGRERQPVEDQPLGYVDQYDDDYEDKAPTVPQRTTSTVKDRLAVWFYGSTIEGWTPRIVLTAAGLFALTGWHLRNGAAAGLSLIAVLYCVQIGRSSRVGRFWFARPIVGALCALLLTTLVLVR